MTHISFRHQQGALLRNAGKLQINLSQTPRPQCRSDLKFLCQRSRTNYIFETIVKKWRMALVSHQTSHCWYLTKFTELHAWIWLPSQLCVLKPSLIPSLHIDNIWPFQPHTALNRQTGSLLVLEEKSIIQNSSLAVASILYPI
jgi:hypothetical protein